MQVANLGVQRVEEKQTEGCPEAEGGAGAGTKEDEGDREGEGDEDCDDPDSAYVNAMEKIWAEAEAWVDAEAQVSAKVSGSWCVHRLIVGREEEDKITPS